MIDSSTTLLFARPQVGRAGSRLLRGVAAGTALCLGLSLGTPAWSAAPPEASPDVDAASSETDAAGSEGAGGWEEGDIVEIAVPTTAADQPETAVEAGAETGAEVEGADAAVDVPTAEADAAQSGAAEAVVVPPAPSISGPLETVHVAVGLSSELDGSKDEKALLDRLERSAAASPSPPTVVRRLRVGAAEPQSICREGRDDLVITIGYLPERADPVLMTRDCLLDSELGVRAEAAADDADLVGVLWGEHVQAVDAGAKVRRRVRISPKLRTGLIAGAAVAVIGVAVGLLIAGAVQRETVVISVTSP
ncbi:hypothetical protein G6O69_18840 [Pseudenhygromyxa sp. WMMC2535]|uniref:hypothetical protein n=1 Tax=Pseudenhygromyxa sp. WMMC2535 TaxID=2712867 RepID=UPI001553FEDD|nr:hypothetical protein [Pseudenhygromyxa sp. WMMC2535]NVB39908.1 hypothetical protein [Pseudenhygromyxa sp. WMMC2535]